MRIKIYFSLLLILLLVSGNVFAAKKKSKKLDMPLIIGPQYPLSFMRTLYEPDTAFILGAGDSRLFLGYTQTNFNEFSPNSDKDDDPNAPASGFSRLDEGGYSVYVDGELSRRTVKWHWGIFDFMEFQYTYRDIRFERGVLDPLIYNFHEWINNSNRKREATGRHNFAIYVFDNDTGENIFQLDDPPSKYRKEALTVGLKFLIRSTKKEALSLKITSNYSDEYIERNLNQLHYEYKTKFRHFNDYNISLNYSARSKWVSFHAAYATTFMAEPVFPKSPKYLHFYFIGLNIHIANWFDLIIQDLQYTSIFPPTEGTGMLGDVNEPTAGFRWFLSNGSAVEFGFVENYSQGPQNMDVAGYVSFAYEF